MKMPLITLLILFLLHSSVPAKNAVSGTISRDTTWAGNILVTGDIVVESGVVLTIEPGTNIIMTAKSDISESGKHTDRIEIIVLGTLIANGRYGEGQITFTSSAVTQQMHDWYGIIFSSKRHQSVLRHCVIEYGYTGISCFGSNPIIESSSIQYNYYAGINCEVQAKPLIRNSIILGNTVAGINCELFSAPVIENSIITQNGSGVVAHDRSRPDLGQVNAAEGGSTGDNHLINNFDFNIYNRSDLPIHSQNNFWNSSEQADINQSNYDKAQNERYGEVIIVPFLKTNPLQKALSKLVANKQPEEKKTSNSTSKTIVSKNAGKTESKGSSLKPVANKQVTQKATKAISSNSIVNKNTAKTATGNPPAKSIAGKSVKKKEGKRPTPQKPGETIKTQKANLATNRSKNRLPSSTELADFFDLSAKEPEKKPSRPVETENLADSKAKSSVKRAASSPPKEVVANNANSQAQPVTSNGNNANAQAQTLTSNVVKKEQPLNTDKDPSPKSPSSVSENAGVIKTAEAVNNTENQQPKSPPPVIKVNKTAETMAEESPQKHSSTAPRKDKSIVDSRSQEQKRTRASSRQSSETAENDNDSIIRIASNTQESGQAIFSYTPPERSASIEDAVNSTGSRLNGPSQRVEKDNGRQEKEIESKNLASTETPEGVTADSEIAAATNATVSGGYSDIDPEKVTDEEQRFLDEEAADALALAGLSTPGAFGSAPSASYTEPDLESLGTNGNHSNQKSTSTSRFNEPVIESFLDGGRRQYLQKKKAEFPESMTDVTAGMVLLEVVVGKDGRILNFRVLRSDGHAFTEAARITLQEYRYKPGTVQGVPVSFKVIERFEFKK